MFVEINSFLVNLIFSCNQNGFINGVKKSIEIQNYDDSGSEQVTKTVIVVTSFTTKRQENTIGSLISRTGIPFGLTLRDMDFTDEGLLAIFSTFQEQEHLLIQDYGFFIKAMNTGKPLFSPIKIKVTNLAPLVPAIDHLVLVEENDDWGYEVYRNSLSRLQTRLKEF